MDARHRRGQTSEYTAACWFSEQGWEIFWSNLGQSSIDFLIVRDNVVQAVQVKSAIKVSSPNGTEYLRVNMGRGREKKRALYTKFSYDILCVCAPDGRIWVIPEKHVPKKFQLTLIRNNKPRYNQWLVKDPQI